MKQTSCPDSGDPKLVMPGWVGVCGAGMEDAVCRLQGSAPGEYLSPDLQPLQPDSPVITLGWGGVGEV